MLQKTLGIVLHTLKYNDTSLIADIYTETAGRASFIVKIPPFAEGCGEIGAVSATRLGGAGGGFPFERQYV